MYLYYGDRRILKRCYEPGRRSHTWRKSKVRHRQEFVGGGWTDGTGARATKLGALMLGGIVLFIRRK